MSSISGNQNSGFVDGSAGVTTFSLGTANIGTLAVSTRLRIVAHISTLSVGNTLSQVTSITDSAGLTWHRAGQTSQLGINQPTGMTGNPLAQGLEIWYTDNFASTAISSPTVYQVTVHVDNDVDSIAIYYSCHKDLDATTPIDANANSVKTATHMSSSATTTSVSVSTNTADIQVMVSFAAVGPGQRPGGSGQPSMNGDTTSDYGQNDTFHNHQNFHIFGTGIYDETGALSSATVSTHDATNNQMLLVVAFTQDSSALSGTLAATETTDIFSAHSGYTGTMAATGTPDNFFGLGVTAASGTLAVTETQDSFATSSGFDTLAIENAASTFGAGSFSFSTNGPNRIVVMAFGTSSVGSQVLQPVASITSTSGLVFTRSDAMRAGQDSDSDNFLGEFWWAHAPHKLIGETVTVTYAAGLSSTTLSAIFAIKGLNGNYADPFDRSNPYSFGSSFGSMLSGTSRPVTNRPVATGPLSSSGAASDFAKLDATNSSHVILSGGNLSATSDQTSSPDNWAAPPISAAKFDGDNHYFETHFTTIHGTKYGVGVLVSDFTPHQLATDGTGGIMLRGDGTIWANGAQVGSLGVTPANGDVIQVFVNLANHVAWFRDLTQSSSWNGNPNASPGNVTDSYDAGGFEFVGSIDPFVVNSPPHYSPGGGVLPYIFLDGTATSPAASQTVNFGGSAFAATPPAGATGWAFPSPAVTPTRSHFPSVIVGMDLMITSSTVANPGTPPGYTSLVFFDHQGSQRHGNINLYAQVRSGNILTTDNDTQLDPTAVSHWAKMYTTFAGGSSPGTFDVTESPDVMVFIGHQFPGVRGDLTAVETSDTFAGIGYTAATGFFVTLETPDRFSAFGFQPLTGTMHPTGAPDRFNAAGIGRGEDGVLITTEAPDIFAAIGVVPISGQLDSTEAADRMRFIGAGVTQVRRRRRRFVT